ncbi:MAG: ATPase with role in protein import into the ER [Claussenomyces sp. TS43310]|nr:MAG: ATPase with role in protein import into the ER [Claussenomyces sp. TS43310]
MPMPRKTTVFSFLGFAAVLCLAILFGPLDVAFRQTRTSTNWSEGEYHDGIDLGRTYSRVGIFNKSAKFEIIVDEQERSMVPSYVAFTDQGPPLVGFAAMDQAVSNPKNTIYDVRCLIGRKFSDPELQDDIRNLPYDVVEKDGMPVIRVQIKGADQYFAPEEISAKVLQNLKNMAETHLNRTVKNAIITVPAHFNDTQRQTTKDAAERAGLSILRFINEATAAGIAYGIDIPRRERGSEECEECLFVIYNLGAKESDLALDLVDRGVFEILALAGDRNLGGDDFENVLLNHAVAQVNKESNIDFTQDVIAMKGLRSEVMKAQQELSTESTATIQIPARHSFNRFSMTITKTQLQELNRQLSDRVLNLVQQLLDTAKTEKREINGIIFTGNPVHIAKIKPILEAYLDGKKTLSSDHIRADQAVVYGAALQGLVTSSDDGEGGCYIGELTRLSLGIEASGGNFTKLISRNTVIPTCKTRDLSTATDNQEKVVIKVLEGERVMASKNRLLGILELTGLSLKPRGIPEIEVVFELNPDEILTVVAREKGGGKEATLVITDVDRSKWEEVETIVMEAESHDEEDALLLREFEKEEDRFEVIAN